MSALLKHPAGLAAFAALAVLLSGWPTLPAHAGDVRADEAPAALENVLPELLAFSRAQQKRILEHGQPLNAQQKQVAKSIGIDDIDRVRVLAVTKLPRFEGPRLSAWADRHGFKPRMSAAYAFGYGVLIHGRSADDPTVMAHELVHVRQMEEMGLEEYFRRYLLELEQYGYDNAPLEQEAIDVGKKNQR